MNKPGESKQLQAPYQFWGRHPLWYKASCLLTFLGKEGQLRKRAVERILGRVERETYNGNTMYIISGMKRS